ncbi:MAG: hypothetical protein ACRDT0_24230 [Pseudonocardiaceae bacterium]
MSEEPGEMQDTRAVRHGDGELAPLGIERSIRPGVACSATVLVADMGDGALLLQGWRAGPSAYLIAEDAVPLRQVLETAFGSELPVSTGRTFGGGQVDTVTTACTDEAQS